MEQDLSHLSVLERVEAVFEKASTARKSPSPEPSLKIIEVKTINSGESNEELHNNSQKLDAVANRSKERTISLSSKSDNESSPVFTRIPVKNPVVMHYVAPLREEESHGLGIDMTDDDGEVMPDPFATPVSSPTPVTSSEESGRKETAVQCMLIGEPLETLRMQEHRNTVDNSSD